MKFQILSALFFISTLSVSKASLFGYFFENFENKIPSSIGTKAHKKSTFQTVRGKASIVHLEETGSTQILELEKSDPYTSVFLDASEFAIYDEVYCEVLVKPTAMNDSQDEEFLDFGGAILGFFHHEDSAEIQVLSSKNENESVWISTGIHYALNEERRPQDWIQIRIRINLSTNRWSLALDDKWVLNGLKALDLTSEIALPLFLYGHLNSSNQFDDLLLTNVNPSQLGETLTQEHVSKNRYGKAEVTNIGDKVVSKIKSNASVRQSIDPLKKVKATGIRIRNVEFALKTGNKVYRAQSDLTSESKEEPSLLLYAPAYDEEGNRKSSTLTLTADVQLEPGVHLNNLTWKLVKVLQWPDQYGETLSAGDFRTGLLQQVTIDPEWQTSTMAIVVSSEGVTK